MSYKSGSNFDKMQTEGRNATDRLAILLFKSDHISDEHPVYRKAKARHYGRMKVEKISRPGFQKYLLKERAVKFQQKARRDLATLQDIEKHIEEKHGLVAGDLKSNRRQRHISRARFEAFYLARTLTGNSFPRIGQFFNKDHTSVLHGVDRHIQIMKQENKT